MACLNFSGVQFAQPASLIDSPRRALRSSQASIAACLAATLIAACGGGGGGAISASGLQITASVTANTSSPLTGQEVRLSPSLALAGTVPAGATVTQVRWDFGDGSPVVSISNAASLTAAQFKSYAAAGNYIVTLGATASTGESGSVTRTISVQSFAPTGVLANTTPGVTNTGNYTRLGADGQALAIQDAQWSDTGTNAAGTRWECIKDNQSGLIWEVKTKHDPSALRHFTSSFTWFDDNAATNGGDSGTETDLATAVCNGVADLTKCNTKSYTTAVKTLPAGQALCGFRDWRMPDRFELLSIALTTASDPAIQATHFPDVNLANLFGAAWSSSSDTDEPEAAWTVYFVNGVDNLNYKFDGLSARLVRSGQ